MPIRVSTLLAVLACWPVIQWSVTVAEPSEAFRPVALRQSLDQVQPMTGIVLWTTNPQVATAPIQLEYAYMTYADIVNDQGVYDWSPLETLLNQVAARKHQLILRWHDTYVGKRTGVPQSITRLADYKLTVGKSEKKSTEFPDWSHPALRQFTLDFFTQFAQKYDEDPRLAFVQVGFGLWAEYHIYDGPMKLGQTFPSKAYQTEFGLHLAKVLKTTPWMISVDAGADKWSAFPNSRQLLALDFGLFDDSFNHAKHQQENEPNWDRLGRDRWRRSPAGGEFSFFEKVDQAKALDPNGPHGLPFEQQAAAFHLSFIIGDDQPRFQTADRIRSAAMACGYRFAVDSFEASPNQSRLVIRNDGIAPIYYDAFPAVNGVPSTGSLKGLLPGESRTFEIPVGGESPRLTIQCARLVPGQAIGYEADLKADRSH